MAGVGPRENRRAPRLLALSGAFVLSACAGAVDDELIARHVPEIERHTVGFEVSASRTARRIDAGTAAALDRFFDGYVRDRGDDLRITTPPGANAAARNAMARAIRDRAVGRGVDGSRITVAAAEGGAGAEPSYRVDYLRHSVAPRTCGDWTRSLHFNPLNRVHPNFGCASLGYIGAMAAHPLDLVKSRPAGPRDAARSNAVIHNYRRGEPTAVKRNPGEEVIRTGTRR